MSEQPKRTRIPLPGGSGRIPTGAMQFEGDWPGLFIRGDDAMQLVTTIYTLQQALRDTSDQRIKVSLSRLNALADMIYQDVFDPPRKNPMSTRND